MAGAGAGFIPQSSGQGALFELVARGNKDTYFSVDKKDSVWAFSSAYDSSAPFIKERRTTVPLNGAQFGATFDVEIDKFGDVLTEVALLIDLPSWLPPLPTKQSGVPTDPALANGLYWITDLSGVSYGYTDGAGYFLFERIQFYQDQMLLQEWSGDGLFATQQTEGSWNSWFLQAIQAGISPASNTRMTALRATPGRLRIILPIPGCQTRGDGGFPLCCCPSQSFRFRIRLRKLEDIVVCSDLSVIKPAPWAVRGMKFSWTGSSGSGQYTFTPVPRLAIGQPSILLETTQVYLPDGIRGDLETRTVTVPFRRHFENIFTFGENDYLALGNGGSALVTRRLDARHPVERVVWIFRNQNAIDRNRLDDIANTLGVDGSFYRWIKLVIAGQDREAEWSAEVWRDLEALAKDERDTGRQIGEMRWNLGDRFEQERPYSRQPEGAVNFSTADRPTLHVSLYDIVPWTVTGQRNSEMRVFMEGWAVYETKEGRGRLLFAN